MNPHFYFPHERFETGTRVITHDPVNEQYETGTVLETFQNSTASVRWDSGIQNDVPQSSLRRAVNESSGFSRGKQILVKLRDNSYCRGKIREVFNERGGSVSLWLFRPDGRTDSFIVKIDSDMGYLVDESFGGLRQGHRVIVKQNPFKKPAGTVKVVFSNCRLGIAFDNAPQEIDYFYSTKDVSKKSE